MKQALVTYTESGGKGKTVLDKAEAVRAMQEKHEICCGLLHGFDWTANSSSDRLRLLPAAQEHILAKKNGKQRCLKAVQALT